MKLYDHFRQNKELDEELNETRHRHDKAVANAKRQYMYFIIS